MDKDTIDNISEALAELFEKLQNTITQYTSIQIMKNVDNPKKWLENQKKDLKSFNNAVNKIIEQFKTKIDNPIKIAFNEVYKDAESDFKDLKKNVEDEKGKKLKNEEPVEFNKKSVNGYKIKIAIDLNNLNENILKGFKKTVDSVGKTIYRKKIESGDVLYKEIEKAMKTGIEDMFKIYKNGRKVPFKSYQEMNVRTTLHQEAQNYQIEAAKDFGVIFYLCSSHGDCANDHAQFQGKVYVDENWKNIIPKEQHANVEKYIKSNNIMSLQKVRDEKPFLTTRPNCRHYFKAITIDQAFNNSTSKLLSDFKMKKGTYDSKKYKSLQQQRYFERQVRFAKNEKANLEKELLQTKNDEIKKQINQKIIKEKTKININQKNLRTLIKENPYLERDYRRENYKTIVQDIGYKYNNDSKK